MAKERAAEERDGSDGSVEEISEEDFKHDGGGRVPPRSSSRAWRSVDLMHQYPHYLSRNYAPSFSSFAWKQAVQNKPLGNFGFGDSADGQQPQGAMKQEICDVADSGEEDNGGSEREEGELEEGEIDDMAPLEVVGVDVLPSGASEVGKDKDGEGVMDTESSDISGKEEKNEAVSAGNAGGGLKKEEEKGEVLTAVDCVPPVMEGKEDFTFEFDLLGDESTDVDVESEDIDERVISILEELETVTEEDVEKSFKGACSRLLRSSESLRRMVLKGHATILDAVIQQAYMAVQIVHSVYLKTKVQNKNIYSRFIAHIKGQNPALFTSQQMEEINIMIQDLNLDDMDKMKEYQLSSNVISVSSSSNYSGSNDPLLTKITRLNPVIRNRTEFSLLLDPHANLDEDSLPSPTRENAPLPLQTAICTGDRGITSQPATVKRQEADASTLHPYVTDALKAVSSYQKKYDRISFMTSNRLPSPTPSEDSDNNGGDVNSEVSSSFAVGNLKSTNSSIPISSAGYHSSFGRGPTMDWSSSVEPDPYKAASQTGYGSKSVAKASAKRRDPRLKFASSNAATGFEFSKQNVPLEHGGPKAGLNAEITMTSRKHKPVDEFSYDNLSLKRQRNELLGTTDTQMFSCRGGWLEDNSAMAAQTIQNKNSTQSMQVKYNKPENDGIGSVSRQDTNFDSKGVSSGNNQVQAIGTNLSVSLPLILKDIAVNPTMLMNLIKQQQKLAAETPQVTTDSTEVPPFLSSTDKPTGQVSLLGSISGKTSGPLQQPDGKTQLPHQIPIINNQSDVGRPRMKPRDPRRILHNNMIQKNESSASRHLKVSGPFPSDTQSSKDSSVVREQEEQAQTSGLPSQLTSPPDIAQQFTKKLKNIANIMSTPQASTLPPEASQNSTQTTPIKEDLNHGAISSGANDHQGIAATATHSLDPWGDMNHLLDGYDDQQKAAIQRERARRIEEQNKMFAASKLCLVLDLDHTLLNSAKFIEVEPNHDEILRKKEEQDREKPQRHLFRFQHMGMWTKLRPGIWNFLEKASKLYELHLYTMGNRLYATEMAKVLDPTGALFAGRVISRGDDSDPIDGDERVPRSKDLEGVLGMESAVVIIDDSVKVWPHNRLNLIVVERYTYFPCSRRQFGLLGPSLLEIDHDERPEDGTLASSLAVIERIHQNFFSHQLLNNVDVRNILASEQRKILGGCRIVFSRIFPIGENSPHLHPLWQTAEQFGAICTNQIDDQVTHVVANSLGTDKVNWALSTGRFVVHPGWVEASALLYRRANEHDFAVKP